MDYFLWIYDMKNLDGINKQISWHENSVLGNFKQVGQQNQHIINNSDITGEKKSF